MKVLLALTIALLFSLSSPAFSQDSPDVFPDEHTRKLARELDLEKVKEICVRTEGEKRVDDPKIIALIVAGLKTANTTNFSNEVDCLEVTGKDGNLLISYRFSLRYLDALSPELAEGLKAAGAEPPGWTKRKEAEKARQKLKQRLLQFAPFAALAALLTFLFFKRKTRPSRK